MSQTRALSKAFRMALGFIVSLAGYETTPSEEMQSHQDNTTPQTKTAPKPKQNEKRITAAQDRNILAYIEDDEVRKNECRKFMKGVEKDYVDDLTEVEANILLSLLKNV